MGSLPCIKYGMKGGPKVLDLSKIISPDGSSPAQLSVLDCVELLAPIVEAVGHQETSAFKAMTEAMGWGTPQQARRRSVKRCHGSVGSRRTQGQATHERGQGVPAGAPSVGDHRIAAARRSAGASGAADASAGYSSRASSHSVGE